MKINKIELNNFRGSKHNISLDLPNSQSCLIYGDNGTGKSSLADAIEWFITDKISHLSGEEVEPYGGIKNTLSNRSAECYVKVSFSQKGLESKKVLKEIGSKLKTEFIENPIGLIDSIEQLKKERVWIRNRELVNFILNTKGQRLEEISEIIGFDHVLKIKEQLKKAVGDIKSIIKIKNHEDLIAQEKNIITKNINSLVNTEEQFLKACIDLIKPIQEKELSSLSELDEFQKELEKSINSSDVKLASNMENLIAHHQKLCERITNCQDNWDQFLQKRRALSQNSESLKSISLSELLNQGAAVLAHHENDNCPLCLQPILKEKLKNDIIERISQLKSAQQELEILDSEKRALLNISRQTRREIEDQIKLIKDFEYKTVEPIKFIKSGLDILKRNEEELEKTPISSELKFDDTFKIEDVIHQLDTIKSIADAELIEFKKKDSTKIIEITKRLAVAKTAFSKVLYFEKESNLLKKQQRTLESILSKFISAQKEGMHAFLENISIKMNELYLFMNPNENVDKIRLESLLDPKSGEFNGIAVKFSFHGQEVLAPKKFLSESQLNCLGLCLFLSSVSIFNNKSKFIILDDVISSFDKNHRTLFARLLVEKFSGYQLLILTHENEWYEYLSSLVKSNGWKILKTKWTPESGLWFDLPTPELQDRIEKKLKEKDPDDLGNLVRRYAERFLKEICNKLEVPVNFQFNEKNENRTFEELYSSLRSKLKKVNKICETSEFKNLGTCQFFSNKSSHDSSYNPNISDLNTVWIDLKKFENLFKCKSCNRLISTDNKIIPDKMISCKCGSNRLDWKFD